MVVLVNRVGFEDGLCFWGGSMAVGPDGRTIAQAAMLDEALTVAVFDRADLRRQRVITPLARDERLLLTIEELNRIKRRRYESDSIPADLRINRNWPPRSSAASCQGDSAGGLRAGGGGRFRRHRFQRGDVPGRAALGPKNVLAVTMPYKISSEATRTDSQSVIVTRGASVDVPITDQIDAYFARIGDARNCGWPTNARASG